MLLQELRGSERKVYSALRSGFAVYTQPKVDGVRCLWTRSGPIGRNGMLSRETVAHIAPFAEAILRRFSDTEAIDGELYADGLSPGEIGAFLRHGKPMPNLRWAAFDCVLGDLSAQFSRRWDALCVAWGRSAVGTLVPTTQVRSMNEIYEQLNQARSAGGEGIVVRMPGRYVFKRSFSALKAKCWRWTTGTIVAVRDQSVQVVAETGGALWIKGSGAIGESVSLRYYGLSELGKPLNACIMSQPVEFK